MLIDTTNIPELDADQQYYVYNALDSALTLEIWEKLADPNFIYNFELDLHAPALEMSLRGMRVDMFGLKNYLKTLQKEIDILEEWLNELATEVWGRGLNARSSQECANFFYKEFNIETILNRKTRKPTTDRTALEKIQAHFWPGYIAKVVLLIRERSKLHSTFKYCIDDDGRFRAAFNVAGTETGRWSSNENPFGTGTNAQNITERLRRYIVADPGMKLCYIDKEQAESRAVAYISGDEKYIEACEGGDLHTTVCKLIWPNLPWTNVLAEDKKIAEQPFYRHFSYRDMSKRGGHGTNYYGKAATMAMHLKVGAPLIAEFQTNYFEAFKGIRKWHARTQLNLQTKGEITTAFGRRRKFFGRLTDDSTLREAIAYEPQSLIADDLNAGLNRVYLSNLPVHILAQVHDAILFQYPEELEDVVIPAVAKLLEEPIEVNGRMLTIPTEAAVGWNWGYAAKDNPDGLIKYKGNDERVRKDDPEASILDRVIY